MSRRIVYALGAIALSVQLACSSAGATPTTTPSPRQAGQDSTARRPGGPQEGIKPDRIVVDSLSSIAASFLGREENYRAYAEQLFRHLEDLGVTSFLITEMEADPKRVTRSGVEEFLADGVIFI